MEQVKDRLERCGLDRLMVHLTHLEQERPKQSKTNIKVSYMYMHVQCIQIYVCTFMCCMNMECNVHIIIINQYIILLFNAIIYTYCIYMYMYNTIMIIKTCKFRKSKSFLSLID